MIDASPHPLPRETRRLRTVLITDGDERSSLAIVRTLGRAAKYEVHVCSMGGRSLAGASKYAQSDTSVGDALADSRAFATNVSALALRLGADVLLPVSEASVLSVLRHRDLFGNLILPLPEDTSFVAACDKSVVLNAARGLGIATPQQIVLRLPVDLPNALGRESMRYPVVLKPAKSVVSTGGRWRKVGVSYAADESELVTAVGRYETNAFPLLVQQRVVGPGIGVFLLRWDKQTIAAFSHRRVREKPPSGGVSVCSESIPADPELVRQAESLLERFAWRGVAMIEFKLDSSTGTHYLMEINGRFWGSLQLAITAGVDFPTLLLSAAVGDQPAAVQGYRIGVRNRWWWGEVDHVIARLRSSRGLTPPSSHDTPLHRALLNLFLWGRSDHNETLHFTDPHPFFRETARWLHV